MYGNERIWNLVQMASQVPRPLGKTSSSNPLHKAQHGPYLEVRLDIARCISPHKLYYVSHPQWSTRNNSMGGCIFLLAG